MNNLQKMGNVAAIGLGVLFTGYMVLLLVVLPMQGYGPGTLNDPANGLAFLATSSLPMLIDLIYLGIAVAFLLISLALYDQLGVVAPSLMQISAVAGLMASALFLGYAMINFVGSFVAVSAHQQDALLGNALYLALHTVTNGLNAAALFAGGWTILLAGWAGRDSHYLPARLSYLMMGTALAMMVSFVLLPVALLAVLLTPIWSIWLGVVGLTNTSPVAARQESNPTESVLNVHESVII